MKSNKKGQILIEVVIALAILIILVTALFSGYNAYLKTKKYNQINQRAIEYVDCLVKELKWNINYLDLSAYNENIDYYLQDTNINSLMESRTIKNLILEEKNNTKECCVLNFNKNHEEVVIKVKYEYNGELNYSYKKEVSKVKYTQ